MTNLNITIPDSVNAFVERQVAQGGYPSASAYVSTLLEQAKKAAERENLETALDKGLDSGPAFIADGEFWKGLHDTLTARVNQRKGTSS
jgi:antitoxin ParD1/3/4